MYEKKKKKANNQNREAGGKYCAQTKSHRCGRVKKDKIKTRAIESGQQRQRKKIPPVWAGKGGEVPWGEPTERELKKKRGKKRRKEGSGHLPTDPRE